MERSNNVSAPLEREELEKFFVALSDYRPALPDELVRHHLARSGFQTADVRVERLIALAAQKFLADVARDAISQSRMRTPVQSKKRDGKLVLTVDDLERALREYGVTLKKPPYYADSVSAGAAEVQPANPKPQPQPPAKPKP